MSTTARYPLVTKPNEDNTGRNITVEYQAPVYAASIALKLSAAKTYVKVGQLTGALSLTAETTRPQIGDELTVLFAADATARTVTFSTGMVVSASTLVVAISKFGSITFCFDGTNWVETGRCVTA
jgi:hypothetical protein